MKLSTWFLLIALLIGLGCVQVMVHNAAFLKGYSLGEEERRLNAVEADVSWQRMRIGELVSPMALARVAEERRLKFVARSTISPSTVTTREAKLALRGPSNGASGELVHIAAVGSYQDVPSGEGGD